MAIQIGSEVCGRCVDWCVWSEMFNTQWPSNEMIYDIFMIPWSSSKNDGAVPMIFRWWQVSEMSNFERYERELQTGKLQWGHVLRSYAPGEPFPTWVPTRCEHFGCEVSSIPANFGQRMWWSLDAPEGLFFIPTAVHGGESVNPSPKANVSGFDPSWIYIYIYIFFVEATSNIRNHQPFELSQGEELYDMSKNWYSKQQDFNNLQGQTFDPSVFHFLRFESNDFRVGVSKFMDGSMDEGFERWSFFLLWSF